MTSGRKQVAWHSSMFLIKGLFVAVTAYDGPLLAFLFFSAACLTLLHDPAWP